MKKYNPKKVSVSADVIFKSYLALTKPQLLLLHKSASYFKDGTNFQSAEDLIFETLARMLDGRRVWDGSIPLVVFMFNAMRSIVSYEREVNKKHNFICLEDIMETTSDTQDESYANPLDQKALWRAMIENQIQQSPEDALIDKQFSQYVQEQKNTVLSLLNKDGCAKQIFSLYLSGLSPRQIMKTLDIDESTYNKARQLITKTIKGLHIQI